jgi:hypothetical protein
MLTFLHPILIICKVIYWAPMLFFLVLPSWMLSILNHGFTYSFHFYISTMDLVLFIWGTYILRVTIMAILIPEHLKPKTRIKFWDSRTGLELWTEFRVWGLGSRTRGDRTGTCSFKPKCKNRNPSSRTIGTAQHRFFVCFFVCVFFFAFSRALFNFCCPSILRQFWTDVFFYAFAADFVSVCVAEE